MSDALESGELPEIDESVVEGSGKAEEQGTTGGAVGDLGLVLEVPLQLSVELGSARLAVREVLALSKGSVVELDRMNGDPADIYVNDRLIARGEVIAQGDRVAVRVTEVISAASGSSGRS